MNAPCCTGDPSQPTEWSGMKQALDGIRIIDMRHNQVGPA